MTKEECFRQTWSEMIDHYSDSKEDLTSQIIAFLEELQGSPYSRFTRVGVSMNRIIISTQLEDATDNCFPHLLISFSKDKMTVLPKNIPRTVAFTQDRIAVSQKVKQAIDALLNNDHQQYAI